MKAAITLFISLVLGISNIADAQRKPKVEHVVIIGVDALSPLGIDKATTPIIDSLVATGASSFRARAVLPTLSAPNWASMLMGVRPRFHKIKTNGWKMEEVKERKLSPTIFKVVRESHPQADIACFHEWKEFERLVEIDAMTTMVNAKSETATIDTASKYIIQNKPFFTFIHLDNVDHAGHTFGHGTTEYFKAVEKVDSLIGKIINSLREANILDRTVILITSDHGGRGKRHGGITTQEVRIPWIINGPTVKQRYRIRKKINTYDTAATISFLLDSQRPKHWSGKPVLSAFVKE